MLIPSARTVIDAVRDEGILMNRTIAALSCATLLTTGMIANTQAAQAQSAAARDSLRIVVADPVGDQVVDRDLPRRIQRANDLRRVRYSFHRKARKPFVLARFTMARALPPKARWRQEFVVRTGHPDEKIFEFYGSRRGTQAGWSTRGGAGKIACPGLRFRLDGRTATLKIPLTCERLKVQRFSAGVYLMSKKRPVSSGWDENRPTRYVRTAPRR